MGPNMWGPGWDLICGDRDGTKYVGTGMGPNMWGPGWDLICGDWDGT